MKLNNLSRLTALLLALTMILPTFAVAEDGTAIDDLTATKLAQMASAEEMIAAGKCSICAGEVTNLNILEWPVAEADCLHAYLGTLAAPAAYEMLLALYDAKSSLYDAYINAHQKHVRDNGAQWTICYDECAAYGGYKVAAPGPTHTQGTCPWWQETAYVPSQTLTDATTGITVTGNLPAGVKLTVTQVNATVDDVLSMINQEDYAEEPSVLRYDITLTLNDEVWQPTTPVTVKVPGVYETVPADPLAEVIHMTSAVAAGYEKLANVTVKADGSVTFDATGFSTYYVVAGSANTSTNNDTFFILRGSSVNILNVSSNTSYLATYQDGTTATSAGAILNRADNTLTFSATDSTKLGTYTVTVGSNRTYTINVLSAEDIFSLPDDMHNSNWDSSYQYGFSNDVYFSVLSDSTEVPKEPMTGGDFSWYYIHYNNNSYTFRENQWAQAGRYASSPTGFLNLDKIAASPKLQINPNGQNVIGVVDSGWGTDTYALVNLTPKQWNDLLVAYITARGGSISISDGKGGSKTLTTAQASEMNGTNYRYQMYPYVVKFIIENTAGSYQPGWHIDCAVVDTMQYSVTYEHNLPPTAIIQGSNDLSLPVTQYYIPETTGVGVSTMTLGKNNINTGTSITIYDTQDQSTSNYTFVEWNTSPDGTGISYVPGDTLPEITANVTLYAIWETTKTTGSLRIDKDVVFTDENDTRKDDDLSYTFAITLSGDTDAKYPYTIYAADGNIIENFNAENGIQNNGTISLKDGQHAIVFNVPAGSVTVTETATNNATPSWQVGSGSVTEGNSTTVTVTAGYTTNVTCTNTYVPLTGTLTITKIVSAAEGVTPPEASFTFNVTLDDITDYSGITYTIGDSTTPSNFNGSITLTAGQTATITGIPANTTYTVTENDMASYDTASEGASGTIPAGGTAAAKFTNTYNPGSLTITKQVNGVDAEDLSNTSFAFTVTDNATKTVVGEVSLASGASAEISNLPVGKYTITETPVDIADYDLTDVKAGDNALTATDNVYSTEIEVKKGENTAVTFTNVYKKQPGVLKITKQVDTAVSGAELPENAQFTFTIELSDKTLEGTYGDATFTNGVATLILTAGETATITDLPADTDYTVREETVPAFTTKVAVADDKGDDKASATTANTLSGEIDAAGTDEVTFTNTYQTGNLVIQKVIDPATGAPADTFTMNVTLSLPTTDSVKFPDSYSVSYSNPTATGSISSIGGTIQLQAGQRATIVGLPHGTTYEVAETDNVSYAEPVAPAKGTIDSAEATVTVTNTYLTGALTITKVVGDVGEPDSDSFTIEVAFTLPNGQTTLPDSVRYTGGTLTSGKSTTMTFTGIKDGNSITIRGLPYGTTYEVTEATPPQYYNAVANYKYSDSQKKIDSEDSDTVEVTNTYNTGTLEITKKVVGNAPAADEFAITVTLTLPNGMTDLPGSVQYVTTAGKYTVSGGTVTYTVGTTGGTLAISGLPVGTTYTVTESTPPSYYTSDIRFADETKAITNASEVDEVTVTNTYNTGSLTVEKSVTSDPAVATLPQDTFTIDVELELPEDNGAKISLDHIANSISSTNGKGATVTQTASGFQITGAVDGTQIVFDNLPHGTKYSVAEIGQPGYFDVKYNGAATAPTNVEIDAISTTSTTKDTTVAITNTYLTGSLEITKVVDETGMPEGDTFEIQVDFTRPPVGNAALPTQYKLNSETTLRHIEWEGKVAKFANIVKGDKITIIGIPYGTTYSVTETSKPGYYSDQVIYTYSDNANKRIDIDSAEDTVDVKNTYLTGSLTITKKVEKPFDGKLTAEYPTEFQFTLVLTDDAGNPVNATVTAAGASMVQTGNICTFSLQNNGNITLSGIPHGVKYTVTEDSTSIANYYTTTVSVNGAEATSGYVGSGTMDATANTVDDPATVAYVNTALTGSLKISKFVTSVSDSSDTFLFKVTGPNGYETTVMLNANENITLANLPFGSYTVSENTAWSWRYSPVGDTSLTKSVDPNVATLFEFTNKLQNPKWLDYELTTTNTFNKN